MRDPQRMDRVLSKLQTFWKFHPELRFFQLLEMIKIKLDLPGSGTFYFEDDELEVALDKLLAK